MTIYLVQLYPDHRVLKNSDLSLPEVQRLLCRI